MTVQEKASQIREIKNFEGWAKQIWYWRTHLDRFIEEYFKVKLKSFQRVDARAFGNDHTIFLVKNRGAGKTWELAVFCLAIAVLYPGSLIAVISSTAEQATLVLKKIDDMFVRNPDILREIDCSRHMRPVQLTLHKGVCNLKNGSKIESYSLGTFRGNRAKVLVCDEAPEIKKQDLEAIARPVLNENRFITVQRGIKDFDSKIVSITSACLKNNYFYDAFVDALKKIASGSKGYYAWAMCYEEAVRSGISPAFFFEKERENMTEEKFKMEYMSYFLGAEDGAVFPYDLTERCRTLKEVEIAQPTKSTSEYVMSLDIATSASKSADNAVLVVFKLIELENGGYIKQLVCIRSFHGKRLDALSNEVRKMLVRFPNTIKLVVDCRGLGDAFPQFMAKPWTDPETGREYPPIVSDIEPTSIDNALPILRPFIANSVINQQMITITTINLEQESIEIPISSRYIINNKLIDKDDEDGTSKSLTMPERAVYLEADALQVEMGNIVGRQGANGSVLFDCAKSTQHKDRCSALMMGLFYIASIEEERKRKLSYDTSNICVGIVTSFK